ncbi:hypothetical protein ELH24_21840 [Rhizobium ruizarguesonis]|nr:hypothetical protein ELH25_25560 [Rhizobium ruizarguesonis]TBD17993.1 hypothetical protein ELH24_21840 [Rhizobium ruizarguesonis]TBE99236.1 hypothetical protein ELG98_22955 [Rhizobium ruizarguesonis]
MMVSRKGAIVSLADSKSEALIGTRLEGSRARSNLEAIWRVCHSLVGARTPTLPTAPIVSERGAVKNPQFPTEQTIYNSYRAMLHIWRKAYYDILNADADPPLATSEVEMIDTSHMDSSSAFVVGRLKEIVFELTQRCNALKRIIDEAVPVPAGDLPEEATAIMEALAAWTRSMANGMFLLDEFGLKVSRRTPNGTRIMDADLFNNLSRFTDDFQNIQKGRKASRVS